MDPALIPDGFKKKEDKGPVGKIGFKLVKSKSISIINRGKEIDLFDPSLQMNGIIINPLRKKAQNPSRDRTQSPKTRKSSPKELSIVKPDRCHTPIKTLKERLSSARVKKLSISDTKTLLLGSTPKYPKSIENTPTSRGSPFEKSSYISFVHKIDTKSRPQSGRCDSIKFLSVKDTPTHRASPAITIREIPNALRFWDDNQHDLGEEHDQLKRKDCIFQGESGRNLKNGLSNMVAPVLDESHKESYLFQALFPRLNLDIGSMMTTPRSGSLTTRAAGSYYSKTKGNDSHEPLVFSSRGLFKGKLIQAKSPKLSKHC